MSYMPDDCDNSVNRAIRWAGAALIAALLIGAALFLTSCASFPATHRHGLARVTAYNPYEKDRVRVRHGRRCVWRWIRWGRRTASGVRAIEGITLAAPKQIPFGTRVSFPQLRGVVGTGEFVVQDRGAGASILHSPEWFDVFVDNKQRMKQFMRLPEFLEYEIEGQQSNQHRN